MALDLANYEEKAREATMAFWGNRAKALQAKIEAGTLDRVSAVRSRPARPWTASPP